MILPISLRWFPIGPQGTDHAFSENGVKFVPMS
jgi:hypothetical protein